MPSPAVSPAPDPGLAALCRALPHELGDAPIRPRSLAGSAARIALYGGLYGAAMGLWRSPWLALWVAIKLPALLLITAALTALVNGWIAQLLGLRLRVVESLALVWNAYALASVVLASFAPLFVFAVLQAPGPGEPGATAGHHALGLLHIAAIAFAGAVAHAKLFALLRPRAGRAARAILATWLLVNLFLGAQLSWSLRPFFGSPGIPVQFLRDEPLRGNFYESMWTMVRELADPPPAARSRGEGDEP